MNQKQNREESRFIVTLDTVSCRTAAIIPVRTVEKIQTKQELCSKNGTGQTGMDDTVVKYRNRMKRLTKLCDSEGLNNLHRWDKWV